MADLVIATGLLALAVAYTAGWRNEGARADPRRLAAFAAALATLLVALLSPLAGDADTSLTAHMVQHVLLLVVVPPLLLAGRTGTTILFALPRPRRRRAMAATAPVVRAARHPASVAVAVVLQLGTMALWHAPALYDAAVRHAALHALEHVTLLATSLLLWWTVTLTIRSRPAIALGGLFVASVGCTALGAAMVLTGDVWYPLYQRHGGSAALADQQLAGVVMWGFANLVLVVAACSIVAIWLTRLERTTPNRPVAGAGIREPAP
jgi:putative membrane protein